MGITTLSMLPSLELITLMPASQNERQSSFSSLMPSACISAAVNSKMAVRVTKLPETRRKQNQAMGPAFPLELLQYVSMSSEDLSESWKHGMTRKPFVDLEIQVGLSVHRKLSSSSIGDALSQKYITK